MINCYSNEEIDGEGAGSEPISISKICRNNKLPKLEKQLLRRKLITAQNNESLIIKMYFFIILIYFTTNHVTN